MEQTNVFKHFKEVANRYDELYGFVYEELSQLTVKHLQLKPNDLLADIGAGTGAISHLIWKKAGLFFNSASTRPQCVVVFFVVIKDACTNVAA